MKKLLYIGALTTLLLAACGEQNEKSKEDKVAETSAENISEDKLLSDKQKLLNDIIKLIEEDDKEELVFNPGDYKQGDIPKGDYAFVGIDADEDESKTYYYSEKDQNGNDIDNEVFDSFGYVYVNETGNIKTEGALFSKAALNKLNASGAKQIYEILSEKTDYTDAGYYKIGVDLPAGSYVLESNGKGYAAIMTGSIGNSEIVNNNNFNGTYEVNVKDGQYLTFTNAIISKQ